MRGRGTSTLTFLRGRGRPRLGRRPRTSLAVASGLLLAVARAGPVGPAGYRSAIKTTSRAYRPPATDALAETTGAPQTGQALSAEPSGVPHRDTAASRGTHRLPW